MYYGMHLSLPLEEITTFMDEEHLTAVQVMSLDPKLYPQERLKAFASYFQSEERSLVYHSSLIGNLVSEKEKTKQYTINSLIREFYALQNMNVSTIVVHPGSNPAKDITLLSNGLQQLYQKFSNLPNISLETMPGAGSQYLSTPEEFITLYSLLPEEVSRHIFICVDTTHIYGAGYTSLTFLNALRKSNLLHKLRVIHFNNTSSQFGSKKERHAQLKQGKMTYYLYRDTIDFLNYWATPQTLKDLILINEPSKDTPLKEEWKDCREYMQFLF